jgi:hypothetical protein
MSIKIFEFGSNPFNNETQKAAYRKLRETAIISVTIWILTLAMFLVVGIIVARLLK